MSDLPPVDLGLIEARTDWFNRVITLCNTLMPTYICALAGQDRPYPFLRYTQIDAGVLAKGYYRP